MPSTYSSSLRLELQATGENANTWGTKTNNNLNLIEQAVAGYVKITLVSASSTYTLDITDGAASDGRNAFIEFVGTVASAISVVVPDVEKGYWVKNSATGSPLTFRTSGGTGFTLPGNEWVFAITDGASAVNTSRTSISGYAKLSSTQVFTGANTFTSAVGIQSTLSVTGNVSMNAGASVSGSIVVNGDQGRVVLTDTYLDLGRNQTLGQAEIFFYTSGTTYDANISRFSAFSYLEIKDISKINIEAPTVDINSRLVVTSVVRVGAGSPVGGSNQLLIFNGVAPVSSVANGIILYAEDVSASSELKVRDEAGNVTTLSPHNFELCGGPSEEMAWGYYSTRNGKAVNVDMMRALRLLEKLSGEKLVFIGDEP